MNGRSLTCAVAALYLCAAVAQPAYARRAAQDKAPTLKKPEKVEVPPSRERRSYDRERDTTYVNIDILLLSHAERKLAGGAVSFEGRDLTLTFQLAYRGQKTYDLAAAYLIVESTAAPGAGDVLGAAQRLEIKADAYEYAYERASYKTASVAPAGAAPAGAPPLKRETAVFKLPPGDLPEIANANRLVLKLGAETFTVKSPQLTELRRTLAAGAAR